MGDVRREATFWYFVARLTHDWAADQVEESSDRMNERARESDRAMEQAAQPEQEGNRQAGHGWSPGPRPRLGTDRHRERDGGDEEQGGCDR